MAALVVFVIVVINIGTKSSPGRIQNLAIGLVEKLPETYILKGFSGTNSYPFLPLRGVLNYDFKLTLNLSLTHGFFCSAKYIGETRSKTIG